MLNLSSSEASAEGCREMNKCSRRRINITVQLHLSGSIGTASHSEMPKIRIIGLFFENNLDSPLNFGYYYLQFVSAFKSAV